MNCLHPFTRKYIDSISGEEREVLCPCGHCVNCLHAEQDAWAIRLGESAKEYKQIVFDTLTIAPNHITILHDFNVPTKDNTLFGSTERFRHFKVEACRKKFSSFHRYYPCFSYDVWKILKKNNFKVFDVDKKVVQDWIKRGRENYFRDTGKRLKCPYFLCKEYGSLTSRPHFHIIMFGVDLVTYNKYFGTPWVEDFGLHKPVHKYYTPWNQKDFNSIVRYVSKYCCKGFFDSPLVASGLQPRPFRLISKGIGLGYLNQCKFDIFKSNEFTEWFKYHRPSDKVFETHCKELRDAGLDDKLAEYIAYFNDCKEDVNFALRWRYMIKEIGTRPLFPYIDLSVLTRSHIESLQVYYDQKGFPHKLPIYYRNKLFKPIYNEKNIYEFEIQTLLQQDARLRDNKAIQEEALELCIFIPSTWLELDNKTWELPPSTLFMVLNNHTIKQRAEAQAVAERRHTRLTNLYNRSKLNKSAPSLL